MSMFCYQCEQTAHGQGCEVIGICGKNQRTATLQDLLVHMTEGIACFANCAAREGAHDHRVNAFVLQSLYMTATNVNFAEQDIADMIHHAEEIREIARQICPPDCECPLDLSISINHPAKISPGSDIESMLDKACQIGIESRKRQFGSTITGLQDLVLYGLKGAAAYAEHARNLGYEDQDIYNQFFEMLAWLAESPTNQDELLARAMDAGQLNYRVMELLDRAHTESFGNPEPTDINVTAKPGKGILVSGHDLHDLDLLLQQTEGLGIHVYTHGEMLPALAYPGLKKYAHLIGNYGGAWQNQQTDFAAFPGPILMTTNCLQEPHMTYIKRLFTTGQVGWPGVKHIGPDKDFSPVISAALAAEGFPEDELNEYGLTEDEIAEYALAEQGLAGTGRTDLEPDKKITIGFGRHTLHLWTGRLLTAMRHDSIRHIYLIGGCDGAYPGRNYYTDMARNVPEDGVIVTLACGKYRFNKEDFGTIDGIPRLLDAGQCNDAYSAIQFVVEMADVMQCDVNDLPVSYILSWYEQKAVAILLTLLSLNIKGIKLGPTLPAFITPEIFEILTEKFDLQPIKTPQQDLLLVGATV